MIPSEIKIPNSAKNLKQKYNTGNQIDGVRNLADLTFVRLAAQILHIHPY